MKRIIALLLCLLMTATAVGCSFQEGDYIPTGDGLVYDPTEQPGRQEMTDESFALAYYPDRSMNPYTCTDPTNRLIFSLVYQGLFAVDQKYNVTPMLCSSYTRAADMCSYSFRVEAATFSDGTVLTAEDVAASLNTAKTSTYYSGRFQHVTSIAVVADAVVIKLDTPCENLPLLLDIPIVKAAEVRTDKPLGTGPYVLDTAAQGTWLRRRQDWWSNAAVPVTTSFITLVTATDAKYIRDQFEYGNVSLACTDPVAADYADYRYDYELWNCETGIFMYLVCNSRSKLFANETVRKTLTHAMDRDALVRNHFRGLARSATLPASPQSPYYSQKLAEQYGYNSQLFAEAVAALPEDQRNVKILVDGDDALKKDVVHSIVKMLEDCGLTVKVQYETGANYLEHLRWGSYDLYLAQTKLSANMDLSAFFANGGALSYGGLANNGIYALCQNALANSGNYGSLHKRIMDDGWLCPLLFRGYGVYAARGVVSALAPARDAVLFYTSGRTMADAYYKG